MGNGGYIHKSNIDKLNNFLNITVPKLKRKFTDNIKIEEFIEYELVNHECYYTGDFSEVLNIIKKYYDMSDEEIYIKVKSVYDSTKEQKLNTFDDDYSTINI